MKSKKLSIAVAIVWFLLAFGWYVFSALNFQHFILPLFSTGSLASITDIILLIILLICPPMLFWMPRRLLIRKNRWHRVGTIIVCIINISFPIFFHIAFVLLGNNHEFQQTIFYDILDSFPTIFLLIDNRIMLLMELLFLLFRKERLKSSVNSEETA